MVVLLGLEAVPTVMEPVPTDLNCTSLFNTMLASKLTGKPEVVDCKTKVFAELVSPKVTRLALAAAPPVFVVWVMLPALLMFPKILRPTSLVKETLPLLPVVILPTKILPSAVSLSPEEPE